MRVRGASDQDIGVGEPKAAGEEGSFAGGQAVHGRGGIVPEHEPAAQQLSLDGLDSALDARVVRRQEADLRDQQRARVQQIAVVCLGERAEIWVERSPADLLVDLCADPLVGRFIVATILGLPPPPGTVAITDEPTRARLAILFATTRMGWTEA